MKRMLFLAIIGSLAVVFGGEVLGCDGCYHSSYDYVKTIKDLEEPARTIALGLWFGAYSSETVANPRILDVGNGRVSSSPDETDVEPDKKYVGYVNFWNSHIAGVTISNKYRNMLNNQPSNLKEIKVPLPGNGEKVLVHIATENSNREKTHTNFSLSNLSVRSKDGDKNLQAKLAIKLFLAETKQYGGMMQSGWGLTGVDQPKVILEKTIEVNVDSGNKLHLKDLIYNELSKSKDHLSIIAEVTTLKAPGQEAQLVFSESQEWKAAAARVFDKWKVAEFGRYEKAEIQKFKASRLLLQVVGRKYIGIISQQGPTPADRGPGDANYRDVYYHIDIITFDDKEHIERNQITKLPWIKWGDHKDSHVKIVDLGTGYGRQWFIRSTTYQQEKLRNELNLFGGDDAIQLLVNRLTAKDGQNKTMVQLLLKYGDKTHAYIKKAIAATDSSDSHRHFMWPLAYMHTDATNELFKSLYEDPRTQKAAGYALIMGKPRRAAKDIYLDMLEKRYSIRDAGEACITFGWMEATGILREIYATPNNWRELYYSFVTLRKLQHHPEIEDLLKAESDIKTYAYKKEHSKKVKKARKTILKSKDKEAAAVIAASLARRTIYKGPGKNKLIVHRIGRNLFEGMGGEARKILKKIHGLPPSDDITRDAFKDVLISM